MDKKPPSLDELMLEITMRHDFAITFSDRSSADLLEEVTKALSEKGFKSVTKQKPDSKEKILFTTLNDHKILIQEASF